MTKEEFADLEVGDTVSTNVYGGAWKSFKPGDVAVIAETNFLGGVLVRFQDGNKWLFLRPQDLELVAKNNNPLPLPG